jgi:hypothetical protein
LNAAFSRVTRTAERIFTKYFGGMPWVRSEVPISSIDPKVTKAVLQRLAV